MLSDDARVFGEYNVFDCLNAPFGARCFLTEANGGLEIDGIPGVLMHLLALGAF